MTDLRRIPDAILADIRARLPILDVIARSVVLRKAGAWHKGLCPFHAEKSPSFAVNPKGRSYHCFGCGAHGDVVGFVQRREGLSFPDAVRRCAAEAGMADALDGAVGAAPWVHRAPAPQPAPAPARDDAMKRVGAAWRIWDRATPITADGLVARYLRGRGLQDIERLAPVLRGAMLRHPETDDALHPVMVARVDGPDGKFAGVHRTYLALGAEGGVGKLRGVDAKLGKGVFARGAVRLHPAARRLGVAEGIETAIAAWNLTGVPVWSCISAGGVEDVGLPFDVEEIVAFADRDKPTAHAPEGRGLQAARRLAARLKAEAVRCDVRLPLAPHGDYADVAAARRAEVAA